MDDIKQIIAKNLSELRIGKKMTQLELAETLNYSDKAVSKWERGESVPDVITLKKIADLFGVTVDYIINEHHHEEKPHVSKVKKHNQMAITLIAFFVVWLAGTFIFALLDLFEQRLWFTFVSCTPLSILVLIIFNSIWGKKAMNMFLVSVLMWTTFLTVYLGLSFYTPYNFWMMFIIGIPGQIIIFLCFRIKNPDKKSRHPIIELYTHRPKRVRKSESATALPTEDAKTEADDESKV